MSIIFWVAKSYPKKKLHMSREQRTNIQNLTTYKTFFKLRREFFLSKGFLEVATQPNLTILSACENPFSVATYTFDGEIWPMAQTGQMILEEVLLKTHQVF